MSTTAASSSSSNSGSISKSWFLKVLSDLDPMSESSNSIVLVVLGKIVTSAMDTAVVEMASSEFLE